MTTPGPYDHVIVGTDGSETAGEAVRRAARLASRLGVPLTVAAAWYRDMPDKPVLSELAQWPGDSPGAMASAWAQDTVADAAAIARTEGGLDEVETATPQGSAPDALIGLAASNPSALLVVGTVGLGSRAERVLGNVPHQITHHAPVDVLLVRTTEPRRDGAYTTVTIGTDGSDTAATAVERGLRFAGAYGARATLLVAATDEEKGKRMAEQARAKLSDEHDVDEAIVVGDRVVDAILDAARDLDLLVIGNKGMSGVSRLLGTVANEVTHRVPTDLLLVNTTRRA